MVSALSNCFGCVAVRGAEYVILNKKYTKEEYLELLPKIKQHMQDMPYVDKKARVYGYGEFFPAEFASFGYNETTAPEVFPLTKEEALKEGFLWNEYVSDTKHEFSDYEIPDDITNVEDDILQKILKCEVTGKAYRIIPAELSFYRHTGLPIPRTAPAERHDKRFQMLLLASSLTECVTVVKRKYAHRTPQAAPKLSTAKCVIRERYYRDILFGF